MRSNRSLFKQTGSVLLLIIISFTFSCQSDNQNQTNGQADGQKNGEGHLIGHWEVWAPNESVLLDRPRDFFEYNGAPISGICPSTGTENAGSHRFGYQWKGDSWEVLGTGLNGKIHVFTRYQNDLVAGGDFTEEDGNNLDHIARWDGESWKPFHKGINGRVRALAEYNGDLIAGGDFTTAGDGTVFHAARWDGSLWRHIGGGVHDGDAGTVGSRVRALAIYDGDLIVAGDFHRAGKRSVRNIARWDGSEWHPMGAGFNGPVDDLIVHEEQLIATGSFSTSGAVGVEKIAYYVK